MSSKSAQVILPRIIRAKDAPFYLGMDNLYPAYASALRSAIAGDERITLLDETLTDAAQSALIASADFVLSPHRSEGFGLHLAEAMAMGKCVIATGWSGNLDFMPEGSAALLPYTLAPLFDPTGIYQPREGDVWAEPDALAGADILQALAADPARRAAMGAAAQDAIATRLPASSCRNALESF